MSVYLHLTTPHPECVNRLILSARSGLYWHWLAAAGRTAFDS